MKYVIFDTEREALEMQDSISKKMGFPRVGRNARTLREAPTKQKTERWAISRQRADGKWGFPSPPIELKERVTVEEYKDEWFPDVDIPEQNNEPTSQR